MQKSYEILDNILESCRSSVETSPGWRTAPQERCSTAGEALAPVGQRLREEPLGLHCVQPPESQKTEFDGNPNGTWIEMLKECHGTEKNFRVILFNALLQLIDKVETGAEGSEKSLQGSSSQAPEPESPLPKGWAGYSKGASSEAPNAAPNSSKVQIPWQPFDVTVSQLQDAMIDSLQSQNAALKARMREAKSLLNKLHEMESYRLTDLARHDNDVVVLCDQLYGLLSDDGESK